MRKLILIPLFLAVFAGYSQDVDLAGEHLQKFHGMHATGTVITLTGAGLMALGGYNQEPEMMVVGGVASVIGFAITVISFSHIGKAGKALRTERKTIHIEHAKSGAGVSLRF